MAKDSVFGRRKYPRVRTEVGAIGKLVRITKPDAFTQELALAFVDVEAHTLKLLEEYLEDAEEV